MALLGRVLQVLICYIFPLGMYPLVDVHTHQKHGCAIELVAIQTPSHAEGFCSLGIHPWHVGEINEEQAEAELKMMETAEVAAIGEIGADKIRGGDIERQLKLFEREVAIAQRRRLPIIIHSVKAFEPIIEILARYPLRAVVFHSWIGSEQQAAQAINRGYMFSFGPRSLASSRGVETLKKIDERFLLLESDDSGVEIAEIYRQVARLREESEEHLREVVFKNFTEIWQNGWSAPSCCSAPRK